MPDDFGVTSKKSHIEFKMRIEEKERVRMFIIDRE
jgi:hypothetical protein